MPFRVPYMWDYHSINVKYYTCPSDCRRSTCDINMTWSMLIITLHACLQHNINWHRIGPKISFTKISPRPLKIHLISWRDFLRFCVSFTQKANYTSAKSAQCIELDIYSLKTSHFPKKLSNKNEMVSIFYSIYIHTYIKKFMNEQSYLKLWMNL